MNCLTKKNAIKFNQNGSLYRYSIDQTNGNTTLTSDTKGRVDIQGLEAGKYYLKETEAPKGYNKIQKSIMIEILEDGTIKVDGNPITGDVRVQNNTGSLLPSTGGMGTTLIYVVGSILVLASGIVLFSKRKERTN
ncbi:SpaA isopeptide-forming pilin-related protein [Catenibacterium sp.]|uniref:SpaA isopeptide-forming pilin-related protein n=1 Tax=Catenibacterium sp. TaxID=2049022 RepID=UPI003FD7C2A8